MATRKIHLVLSSTLLRVIPPAHNYYVRIIQLCQNSSEERGATCPIFEHQSSGGGLAPSWRPGFCTPFDKCVEWHARDGRFREETFDVFVTAWWQDVTMRDANSKLIRMHSGRLVTVIEIHG